MDIEVFLCRSRKIRQVYLRKMAECLGQKESKEVLTPRNQRFESKQKFVRLLMFPFLFVVVAATNYLALSFYFFFSGNQLLNSKINFPLEEERESWSRRGSSSTTLCVLGRYSDRERLGSKWGEGVKCRRRSRKRKRRERESLFFFFFFLFFP